MPILYDFDIHLLQTRYIIFGILFAGDGMQVSEKTEPKPGTSFSMMRPSSFKRKTSTI